MVSDDGIANAVDSARVDNLIKELDEDERVKAGRVRQASETVERIENLNEVLHLAYKFRNWATHFHVPYDKILIGRCWIITFPVVPLIYEYGEVIIPRIGGIAIHNPRGFSNEVFKSFYDALIQYVARTNHPWNFQKKA